MEPDFYLASRSPRRMQMLREAGLRFASAPADLDEQARAQEAPAAFAQRMALEKACTVFAEGGGLPALGADTDVALGKRILGKPSNRMEAIDMLLQLSGRIHEVHSAVALVRRGQCEVIATRTEVLFGRICRTEAEAYWDSGEPADKAGAYAIQGLAGRWVREIRGSYSGVVGLPLYETLELLARHGICARR